MALPFVITAAMFLADTHTDSDRFKEAFSILTAVFGFIGDYAAA